MREPVRELLLTRCASALLRPPAVAQERSTPPACDYSYSRLSGVAHLRPSGSGVLQPPNLLCEAFACKGSDSSGGAFYGVTLPGRVRHRPRPSQGGEDARGKD